MTHGLILACTPLRIRQRVPGRIISGSNEVRTEQAHRVNEVCNCRPKPICNPCANVWVQCSNDEWVFAPISYWARQLAQYDVANKTCCLFFRSGRVSSEITKHLNVMSCKLRRQLPVALYVSYTVSFCSFFSFSSRRRQHSKVKSQRQSQRQWQRKVNKLCRNKINAPLCNDPNTYEGPSRNVCLSQKSTGISNFKDMPDKVT